MQADRQSDVSVIVEDLVKRYRSTRALDGASMSFGRGITCVLGKNGAGKSTMVRQVVGVEKPTSGSIRFELDATEVVGADRAAVIGWLPQSFGFPSSMTVHQFVTYAGWLKGLSRAEAEKGVVPVLSATGLEGSAAKRLSELSGGTLRRAGLAAATVHAPRVLVLDEPTAGLDPMQRADFHGFLRSLAADTAVLLATHLLEDVEAVAETIHVLDDGRFVWHGTPRELAAVGHGDAVSVDALRAGLMSLVGPTSS